MYRYKLLAIKALKIIGIIFLVALMLQAGKIDTDTIGAM